ncbi:hypothetical protein F2P79_000825 [Pimephales promelas]|nr:hypothetical protein F2P79_000825 [Pimephales promelas]
MKLLFQVLLLVVMFALQKSQKAEFESTTEPTSEVDLYGDMSGLDYDGDVFRIDDESLENVTVPTITVYQQMEDREHDRVIVVCTFDQMFKWGFSWGMLSFELSVESELNYTIETGDCSYLDRRTCVYMVTVSPPASFTCEHELYSNGDFINLRSQTYTYKRSDLDHHEEGASLFYICFSSFIAVGLFIMTVAVIVTTIRNSVINPTTVTDNDYMDA